MPLRELRPHVPHAGGAELVAFRTVDGPRAIPLSAIATVRVASPSLPGWLGAGWLESLRRARSRAGLEYPLPVLGPDRFRAVDLEGLAGVAAVVAAATAQLGWPYLWGGESRAEGGFDCSGLIDYAFGSAGFPVGRPTAAGLQTLTRAIPLAAARAGDLVFVGSPAHHVGLVVAPGLAIEAPHRGAVVHYEPLPEGGWTSAGRLAALAATPSVGEPLPDWVRRAAARAAGREPCGEPARDAARGADRGRERLRSGVRLRRRRTRTRAVHAGDMVGTWNPWRSRSPFEPTAAIHAQARYLRRLVDRADGDLGRALAAYHDGWAGSAGGTWSPLTRAYVATILRRFGGPAAVPPLGDLVDMRAAPPGGPVLRLVPLRWATPNG